MTGAGPPPAVDAVVVAYRNGAVIDGCVRAALAEPEVRRVIVVDHGDDGSADIAGDRKSTRLNSSHYSRSRMPSSA